MHCRKIQRQFLLSILLGTNLAPQSITGATKATARPVIARAATGLKMLTSIVYPKKLFAAVAHNKLKTILLGAACYAIWDLLPVAKARRTYKKEKRAALNQLELHRNEAQVEVSHWSLQTTDQTAPSKLGRAYLKPNAAEWQKLHILRIAESNRSWRINSPFPEVTRTWNAYTDYARAQVNSRIIRGWHNLSKGTLHYANWLAGVNAIGQQRPFQSYEWPILG